MNKIRSSIFIPKTINVGYQNRSDTYTKKLAYVIYYDESGKLRKETSWQSWRDEKLGNNEFDNVPTEGFVLNKKVGDYVSDWNHRQAYVRVYDPRNFEFEITVENLLYILENTSSIKGKGLEGEFVYGWDGKDLILMPVESPDYKEIKEYTDILYNKETIKAKDLIIGATYLDKDNNEYIYMGKYNCYESVYIHSREERRIINNYDEAYKTKIENIGKKYWFASKSKYSWDDENTYYFNQFKTLSKKFIKCKDTNCHTKYAELFDKMEKNKIYSPVDDSKDEYIPMTLEDFKEIAINEYHSKRRFINKNYDRFEIQEIRNENTKEYNGEYECYLGRYCKDDFSNRMTYAYNIIPNEIEYKIKTRDSYYGGKQEYKKEIPVSLERIYEIVQPVWQLKYLENGKLYEKRSEY